MRVDIPFLSAKAYRIRMHSINQTTWAHSGHVTSALSAADIMSVLFFHAMQFDPDNFAYPNNDRFILSKGHAAPALYAVWAELGKLTVDDLKTYRLFGSPLEGHPTLRFPYAEAATGSLGIGLSIGLGEALSAQIDKKSFYTYVLMGDSEVAEGSVWEAAEIAAYYAVDNLIGIIDMNRLGQSTETMYGHDMAAYEKRFHAFGWEVFTVDGHDIAALVSVLDQARQVVEKPVMIIAKTYKGYGVDFLQDKEHYHGKAIPVEQLALAHEQLAHNFPKAAHYDDPKTWAPYFSHTAIATENSVPTNIPCIPRSYTGDQTVATRDAFGHALVAIGRQVDAVISLDAEVNNSTRASYFAEAYPDRFIQCFIAEQNMVSMAVGLQRRGKIPFVSTFGAFLSRAHDQIRMAAIGSSVLRIIGSHAGVSIGKDGPSQMALEDIAMMRGLAHSVVLYPSDAVSAYKCTYALYAYNAGISYLRTTRSATPVLYESDEQFPIGGCKILQQSDNDRVLIVAAGITVHEALAAYHILQKKGVSVAVIDMYSVKPWDEETILAVARASGSKIITVEDHYQAGGIGEAIAAVCTLHNIMVHICAVSLLPRSGTMAENLAYAGIDADAIVNTVFDIIT